MAANQFIPITDLPLLPGLPALGHFLPIQAAGVTYKVDARSFPSPNDTMLTWVSQTTDLPGSRMLTAGAGIAISFATPGVALIQATGGGINITDKSFLTINNDTADMPNSRRVLAGANITFDDTVPGIRTIASSASAGQASIQFEDEGVNLGGSGTATEVDFVGAGVVASRVANKVTVTVAGGGGGTVTSVVGGFALDVDSSVPTAPVVSLAAGVTTNATATGAVALDLDAGDKTAFNLTLTGNTTLSFTDPPPTGKMFSFTVIVRQGGAGSFTLTYPASVDWSNGIAPTLSTTPGDVDVLQFFTIDGGTNWFGAQIMADVS